MVDDQAKDIEIAPCPFCGGAMVECNDEDGHYWVHPGRHGMSRANCWLADSWVSDQTEGEGSIGEWNARAVSISRASQGAGVETPLRDAAQSLIDEGYLKGKNDRHGFEMDGERAYLVDADAFDALVAALSPPATPIETGNPVSEQNQSVTATPQASEDVISAASDIALSMTYDRALANQIISALADASLLATPVTVTMEECDEMIAALGISDIDFEDRPPVRGFDLSIEMRRVLGDRIQISGEQS